MISSAEGRHFFRTPVYCSSPATLDAKNASKGGRRHQLTHTGNRGQCSSNHNRIPAHEGQQERDTKHRRCPQRRDGSKQRNCNRNGHKNQGIGKSKAVNDQPALNSGHSHNLNKHPNPHQDSHDRQ